MITTLLGLPQLTMIFAAMALIFGVAGIATGTIEKNMEYTIAELICVLLWIII